MAPDKVMVDFHSHTSWSDGHSSLPDLIKLADDSGLTTLAVTDHDDLRALSPLNVEDNNQYTPMEFVSPGIYKYKNTEVVRGVELSVNDNGKTVHLLGIYLNEPNEEVGQLFEKTRAVRIDRFKQIISKLNDHPAMKTRDIEFNVEQTLMDIVSQGVPSRLHAGIAISRALKQKEEEMTALQALDVYLNRDSPAYVSLSDTSFPPPKKGIELILGLNGLPVLPHLVEVERTGFEPAAKIAEYLKYGLVGFEAVSGRRYAYEKGPSDYSWVLDKPEISELKLSIPKKFPNMQGLNGKNIIRFFGSDFHGKFIPERTLGIEIAEGYLVDIRKAYNAITR